MFNVNPKNQTENYIYTETFSQSTILICLNIGDPVRVVLTRLKIIFTILGMIIFSISNLYIWVKGNENYIYNLKDDYFLWVIDILKPSNEIFPNFHFSRPSYGKWYSTDYLCMGNSQNLSPFKLFIYRYDARYIPI